jgi:hypothetical protein
MTRDIFTRLGKAGTYQAPGKGSPVPSLFIFKLGQEVIGELGQVTGVRDEVSIITEDIQRPERNGVISILNSVDPDTQEEIYDTYDLVSRIFRDGFYEKWVVRSGTS